MKARIEDPDALRAISPAALVAYVVGEGWQRAEKYGEHSDIYARDGRPELVLPGTDALGDYPAIVSDVLRALAREEARDELQLYRDLVGADRDVVRIKSPHSDDDGSITIESGVELVVQSRDMLQAAACAAREPRAAYRAGKVKDAATYMERVRLGQTEQSSFIITLLAPVPPALNNGFQGSLWPMESDEPFDRKVTRTLAKSLEASHQAAENSIRGDGMSAFQSAIRLGVSANLCDALSTLIARGSGLEISVTWARTRPTPEARRVVKFSKSEGEIFQEAAREFRSMEPRPDERLEAFVVALDRQPDMNDGNIRLKTFIDGQAVSVRTKLANEAYHRALTAHEHRQPVFIMGDLKRHGQRWVLENPRNLEVIFDETDDED